MSSHSTLHSSPDLSHLAAINRKVTISLRPNIKKIVDVEFHFMNHCHSRAVDDADQKQAIGSVFNDGSVHSERNRVPDTERYALSKNLVRIIDELIDKDDRVTQSRHDNYYIVRALNYDGQPVDYVVFMRAEKKQRDRSGFKYICVKIESAYILRQPMLSVKAARKATFSKMLGECWS